MIKSNSKEVKEAVKKYIMDNFKDILSDYLDKNGKAYNNELSILETVNTNNYKEVCTAIYHIFKAEKLNNDCMYKAGKATKQDMFIEWCSGLCSAINTNYYYNVCAVDLLGEWLHETEQEKSKFSEDAAAKMITLIIYRELTQQTKIF